MQQPTSPCEIQRQSAQEDLYPRARTKRITAQEEKPNFVIQRVIAVQVVLCLLLSAVTFAVFKMSEPRFTQLKQAYFALFSRDMENAELQETFRRVSDFVFKPPQTEGITENAETPSDSAVQETTTEPEPESEPETERFDGAGGEDLLYPDEITSFSPFTVTGRFTVPVQYKRVTSNFGYRENPVTHKYGFHSGIDLSAPEGTPIYAAYAGPVSQVSYSEARGNYIILDHGNGVRTVYCHCSAVTAPIGANLKSGEVIALVGATGQATGPHLHFEIWLGDTRCNPAWILDLYADNHTGC